MTRTEDAARVLTIVVCGAGPASEVGVLVRSAQSRGWAVDIVATPAGIEFLDVPALEALTGTSVRDQHRRPRGTGTRSLPDAQAVIVAPATYNTICKLALGISDTYALTVLAEAVGRRVPVAILPFVNAALASRKPFTAAVESLRAEGVRVLLGPGEWLPHAPGTGGDLIRSFPWAAALAAVGPPAAAT